MITPETFSDYSWFVETVKQIKKKGVKVTIEEAVDTAVDEMPEDFMIKRFLLGNRAEVKSMCLTEYNEAESMQKFKEEGREEERKNTARERQCAEKAEEGIRKAEEEIKALREELARLKAEGV